jgi:hypothetical protein
MFIGHTAVALAARSRSRDVSLGALMTAAFALDLIWPVLLLAGIEEVRIVPHATAFNALEFVSYPWSHSLLMALFWSLGAFVLARRIGVSPVQALVVAAAVVSHWMLDFITHVPDLPLWPGNAPKVGLGLWNSVPGTLALEGILFAGSIAMYTSATRARDRIGSGSFWSFAIASALMWASSPWSTPPPSERFLAIFSLGVWLLIAWAAWADRHRQFRTR